MVNGDRQRTIELLIKAGIDGNSVANVRRKLAEVQTSVKAMQDILERHGVRSARANVVANMLKDEAEAAEKAAASMSKLAKEREKAAAAAKKNIQGTTRPRGDLGSAFSNSAQILRSYAPTGEAGQVLDFFNSASDLFNALGGNVGLLAKVAIPAAAAVGALAIASNKLREAQEAAAKHINGYIASVNAQTEAVRFAQTANEQSIQIEKARRATLLSSLEAEKAQIQAAINEVERVKQQGTIAQKLLLGVDELAFGNARSLREELTKIDGKIGEAAASLRSLSGDLVRFAVEINKLKTDLSGDVERFARNAELRRSGTSDQIGGMIQSNNDRQQGIIQALLSNLTPLREALGLDPSAIKEVRQLLTDGNVSAAVEKLKELISGYTDLSEAEQALVNEILGLGSSFEELAKDTADLENNVLPLVRVKEAIKNTITEVIESFDRASAAWVKIADLTKQRAKELESERREAISADYQRRIEAAKAVEAAQDRLKRLAQIEADGKKALADIGKRYMASELEATRRYILEEKRLGERANLERLRLLEDIESDLTDLAAQNDVAGFVRRQQQAEKELRRQQEDQDLASKERQDAYNEARRQAAEAYAQQLSDQQAANEERLAAERLAAETSLRESERLAQEFQALKVQWEAADREALRAERAKQHIEDMKQARKEAAEAVQPIKDMIAGIGSAVANLFGLKPKTKNQSAIDNPNADVIGNLKNFASGIDYVPYDMIAKIHKGERIVPAQENRDVYSAIDRGRASGGVIFNPHIEVHANVGEIVTPSQLSQAKAAITAAATEAAENSLASYLEANSRK